MTKVSQEFAMFMSTNKMKALFQRELPDCLTGEWTLTDCEIQHPRFKTYLSPESREKSFLALAYHLKGINNKTHKADNRILYVKAYLGSRSHDEYLKASTLAKNSRQVEVLHLDKYGMVAWFFPFDPALPWLPNCLDIWFVKTYLSVFLLVKQQYPPPVVRDVEISIINYRPEIRCTYKYDIKKLSGSKHTIYGKTFADDKGAEIHRRIVFMAEHTKNKSDSFVIPSPLGYDEMLHTLWLAGLAGKPLIEAINDSNVDQLTTQLAKLLHDFQNVSLPGLDSVTEDDLLTEIQKKVYKLQNALPILAERFTALINQLKSEKTQLPLLPFCLGHCDFHIQQLLLLDSKRIALFDFDELAMANPLMDLANFSADLYSLDLEKSFVGKTINRFFSAYKKISHQALNESHFIWHLRIQVLTRAYRAYIQQKPDLEKLVTEYLETAELFALNG